ncbi:MAG: TonB-dependent receptor [Acidobacteriia bacterium]|nr:TonB-dependent receptor [Terriglobia bacterium]
MKELLRRSLCYLAFVLAMVAAVFISSPSPTMAQATVSTGSIQGTVSDPTGAVVPDAAITITNRSTGQALNLTSTSTGTYNSGPLSPGIYVLRVGAKGFKTTEMPVTVQVGVASPGSVKLAIGSESTVVSVEESAVSVNTEQATVQGVMTAQQIEQLPIGGRNFLDLAQLQPGVQIQDGGNFDPTKNGFSSISFGGRFGRTARIEVDGVDISDETVGTTTQNIPASAIQEFQISQSTLDLSTELTSSGAVNVATRSGSNAFHGESFVLWRSNKTSARLGDTEFPFDRQQYGARFGGPLIKDKLFFFADWERTVQDLFAAVQLPTPFNPFNGGFNSPFHETQLLGRLDWQIKPSVRAFYRWTYNQNNNTSAFIPNTFEPFANRDNTPVQAAGLDFNTGSFTHSVRFGYTRFNNAIADATAGTGITDPFPGVNIHIGPLTNCTTPGDVFCSGVNILAPQATVQHNTQFKYDGSKIYKSHIIRYGVGVNRILGGGFAKFFSSQPIIRASFTDADRTFADSGPFPGGEANPLNYAVGRVRLGNGQGFFTEIPQLGFPAGGQFDTRFAWYIGDTWKARPNLTISYGVRYARDTGRSDSDLGPIPVLDQFGAGLGAQVHQPNHNFAPQLSIAWDPKKNGKTVIRAGAGLFYENAVFNNILFDRPGRLQQGLFFGIQDICPSGSLVLPNGSIIDTSAICNGRIGNVAGQLPALAATYQAAIQAAGASANPNYIGTTLSNGVDSTGNNFISPDYRTPYSLQFNLGIQHEIRPGTVLTVDYLRNIGLHYLLYFDTNHVGDARFLNKNAALNAINATNAAFGCPAGVAGINCAITAGATMVDYAGNGLDSGVTFLAGTPASINGLTPDTGAAFPGINPNLGENQMLFPIGRSVYNALQVSLRSNVKHPFSGLKNLDLQISYSLSRFNSMATDQDFINPAFDFANTNSNFGPNGLDRTHQFSFGGIMEFPGGFRTSFISHIYTALPLTLFLPATGDPGEIFRTDVTGDGTGAGGTAGDVLPGTNIGSFGRDVKVGDLNNVISNYNNTQAGHLTPAGQALVSAGLFTQAQLLALGAVSPTVQAAPAGQVGLSPLLTFDLRLGWVLKPGKKWARFGESFAVEPTVSIFNLFNFANFDSPNNLSSGELNGGAGSPNGTTAGLRTNKIGLGTGVFGLGAPRQFEFGVKVTF